MSQSQPRKTSRKTTTMCCKQLTSGCSEADYRGATSQLRKSKNLFIAFETNARSNLPKPDRRYVTVISFKVGTIASVAKLHTCASNAD